MAAIFPKSSDLILKVAGGAIGLGAPGISAYAYHFYPTVIAAAVAACTLQLQTPKSRRLGPTHYMYLNKDKGQMRIPLDQAQELFMREIAAGKPFYPGKATVPKKEEPDTNAPAPAEQEKK